MSQTKAHKFKTHMLCSITCFKNRTLYEIILKSIVELDRWQYGACALQDVYLRLQTNTQNSTTNSFFSAKVVGRTRRNVMSYVLCLSIPQVSHQKPINATWPVRLMLLNFVILILCEEE